MDEWQQDVMMNLMSEANVTTTTALSVDQQKTITTIQLTVAAFSVLGAGSTFFAMICRHQVTRTERGMLPYFQLSMADILAAMCVVISCSLYKTDEADIIVCNITTTIATGFYLVSFSLTVTFAIEALRKLKDNDKLDRLISVAYVVSWTIYIPYFAIAFPADEWSNKIPPSGGGECRNYQCLVIMHHINDSCMENEESKIRGRYTTKAFFLAVLSSTFLALTVLYLLIYRRVKKKNSEGGIVTQEHHDDVKHIRNRGILHCSIFVVCWWPTFILGFVTYIQSVSVTSWPVHSLYILQAILSPSQGFMNSIVYGWSRTQFHRSIGLDINVSPSRVPFGSWKNRSTTVYHTFSDNEVESSDAEFTAIH